jgi:hypothetical protein
MKKTLLIKSIAVSSLMMISSLSIAQSTPINSLDCSDEEILSYASKDNYKEPLGISVMPSFEEYKPAYTMQENTEKPPEELGCPTIIPDGAWDSIVGEYDRMKEKIEGLMEDLNNFSAGGFDPLSSIQNEINRLIKNLREEANQSVCTRIKNLGLNSHASDVMWDVIDNRFGFDEEAYKDGTKTVIHEIIKDQSRQNDGELVGLFEQMGVKKDGENLVDFFAKAGLETDGISNEAGGMIDDNLNDQIGDVSDDLFGDSDNPFSDTIDDIIDDATDSAQDGTNVTP